MQRSGRLRGEAAHGTISPGGARSIPRASRNRSEPAVAYPLVLWISRTLINAGIMGVTHHWLFHLHFCRPGTAGISGIWPFGRLRTVALIGLASLALSGCATAMRQPASPPQVAAGESVEHLRGEAAAALETRRVARAKQLYESILAHAPDDPEAFVGLGEAEVMLGEFGPALEHSRKAAERAGERAGLKARALHNSAIALLLTDRAAEAETALKAAVENDPRSWRAWNTLGRARDAHGNWEQAREAYERALALAPSEGAVLNNFGLSKLSAGDLDGAAALFVRALEASPDLAVAETNLRLTLALRGQYDEALAGVAAANLPDALNNAGYAALLRGDYPKARVLFLQAIDASPSFYEPSWSNLRFLSSVEQRQALAPRIP
jgi:Flp pilus assembly protein TadD